MDADIRGRTTESKRVTARKVDAAGWGLFFIWVGITFLASLGWGVGLLGVGVIILGVQLARRYADLAVERFSALVGVIFLFGGVWELLGKAAPAALVPVLFIIAGALLLISALTRRPVDRTAG